MTGYDPLSQSLSSTPPGYPVAIEKRYATQLRGVARRAHRYLVRHLRDAMSQQGVRLDVVDPTIPPGTAGLIGIIAMQWTLEHTQTEVVDAVSASLHRTAEQTARYALRTLDRALGMPVGRLFPQVAAFGGYQADVIKEWTELNAMLIGATGDPKSIPNKYFTEVAEYVRRAQLEGQTVSSLSSILTDRYGVATSRANLIARTELAKLNGDITQAQQTDVGITSYVWDTSRDQRVRESHRVLQGQTFEWDSPPPVGRPGQDFQCRCIAHPVLPDWAREGERPIPGAELIARFQE